MTQTIAKTIRVTDEQWEHIEKLAADRNVSANQLLVELALEALDRREWPRTDAEFMSRGPPCSSLWPLSAT